MLIFNYHKHLPIVTELKAKYLKDQVIKLKNIHQPVQKSQEWYEMRNNMLTASDWGAILEENYPSAKNNILLKKCGENKFITCAAMDWGNKYEEVANLIYQHRNKVEVLEFGCLRHPSLHFLGASPDGITPDGIMLEIKCPVSRKITGIPPHHYWCQVQGQLEVCELDRCDFLECSLKEYGNDILNNDNANYDEELYINDNYENDYTLNSFGNEKGVIAEYKRNDKTNFYVYSPVCIIGEELDIWKKSILKLHKHDFNLSFSKFTYWRLEKVSCVPIYRNQEWFNEAKVDLEIFWNKVLKYRTLGIDKLREDIQNEKDIKNTEKLQLKEEKEKLIKEKKPRVTAATSTSSKSQKKIKDFITLDNEEITDKNIIESSLKNRSNTLSLSSSLSSSSSSSSSDEDNAYDDTYDDFDFKTSTSFFSD